MRGCRYRPIIAQLNRQVRTIRELMARGIHMAGEVATESGIIVFGISVHVDLAVPVITDDIGGLVERQVVGRRVKVACSSGGIGVFNPMAGGALVMAGCENIGIERIYVVDNRTSLSDNLCLGVHPIWREAMARITIQCKVGGFGMTGGAVDTDSSFCRSAQVGSVAQGAGGLNIAGRIVERIVGPGPGFRMGVIIEVAPLAAVARCPGYQGIINADIEARIIARSGIGLIGMAPLAESQIGLGVLAVQGRIQVRTIQWMRGLARSAGMASKAVKAG